MQGKKKGKFLKGKLKAKKVGPNSSGPKTNVGQEFDFLITTILKFYKYCENQRTIKIQFPLNLRKNQNEIPTTTGSSYFKPPQKNLQL